MVLAIRCCTRVASSGAGHSLNESGWSTCARPNLLTLIPVTNLLISGPRFLDSPCHTIVIRQSRHVEIGHVRVLAPPSYDQMDQSNNTDGIDVDGEYLCKELNTLAPGTLSLIRVDLPPPP